MQIKNQKKKKRHPFHTIDFLPSAFILFFSRPGLVLVRFVLFFLFFVEQSSFPTLSAIQKKVVSLFVRLQRQQFGKKNVGLERKIIISRNAESSELDFCLAEFWEKKERNVPTVTIFWHGCKNEHRIDVENSTHDSIGIVERTTSIVDRTICIFCCYAATQRKPQCWGFCTTST